MISSSAAGSRTPAATWSRPGRGTRRRFIDRLGYTYFLRGDLGEAERYYHQAAEADPTSYGPHLNLAKLAIQARPPGRGPARAE